MVMIASCSFLSAFWGTFHYTFPSPETDEPSGPRDISKVVPPLLEWTWIWWANCCPRRADCSLGERDQQFAFGTHATPKPFMAGSIIWLTRAFFQSQGGQE